jgi:hypothetical protein
MASRSASVVSTAFTSLWCPARAADKPRLGRAQPGYLTGMQRSRGIDSASGADEIRDAFGREGLELELVQRDGGWLAVGHMHGTQSTMARGESPDQAAQAAWQRHLETNAGTGES